MMFYEIQNDPYCYPGTDVLKNKFDVRNNESLREIEERITSIKISEILNKNYIKGNLDLKHLKDIHKHIFKDIYDFAGEIRTVNISKGDIFCLAQHIDTYSKSIFDNLKKDNYLIGLGHKDFTKKLAEYMGDINALHPFREGNGRTQRVFIQVLSHAAGYKINFSNISKEQMIEVSKRSLRGDNSGFEKIFNDVAYPIRKEEQINFIKSITENKNSPILKAYRNIFKDSIKDKLVKSQEISKRNERLKDIKISRLER